MKIYHYTSIETLALITAVVREPVLSKTQQQQAYVKESLKRAFNEVKEAKLEVRKLQNVDDFLKELDDE